MPLTLTNTQTTIGISNAMSDLLDKIDQHLSSMPSDRRLVTVDEHTDMLLDVRLAVTHLRDAASVASERVAAFDKEFNIRLEDEAMNEPLDTEFDQALFGFDND